MLFSLYIVSFLFSPAIISNNCVLNSPEKLPVFFAMTFTDLCDFKRAFPCNLRGEITDEDGIGISNNQFQFNINANQPATFILK